MHYPSLRPILSSSHTRPPSFPRQHLNFNLFGRIHAVCSRFCVLCLSQGEAHWACICHFLPCAPRSLPSLL